MKHLLFLFPRTACGAHPQRVLESTLSLDCADAEVHEISQISRQRRYWGDQQQRSAADHRCVSPMTAYVGRWRRLRPPPKYRLSRWDQSPPRVRQRHRRHLLRPRSDRRSREHLDRCGTACPLATDPPPVEAPNGTHSNLGLRCLLPEGLCRINAGTSRTR